MTAFLAALTAAQILIAAPLDAVGTTRRDAARHFGEPSSIGTDVVESPHHDGVHDHVVTLDYPKTRVRIYEIPSESASYLLSVATIDEAFPTRTGVRVGVDRGAVLRELGAPAYEDVDQIVYVEPRAENPAAGDRVRIVIAEDRVVGIEWSFAR